jgi:hypothetical protein
MPAARTLPGAPGAAPILHRGSAEPGIPLSGQAKAPDGLPPGPR